MVLKGISSSGVYPNTDNVNYLVIFVGLICFGLLFLPLVGSAGSRLPDYLHITLEIKLFASFVLGIWNLQIYGFFFNLIISVFFNKGMVTMVILKAWVWPFL